MRKSREVRSGTRKGEVGMGQEPTTYPKAPMRPYSFPFQQKVHTLAGSMPMASSMPCRLW